MSSDVDEPMTEAEHTEDGSNEQQEYGITVECSVEKYITVFAESREEAEREAEVAVGDNLSDDGITASELDINAVSDEQQRVEELEAVYGSLVKQHLGLLQADDRQSKQLAKGLKAAITQIEELLNDWAHEEEER